MRRIPAALAIAMLCALGACGDKDKEASAATPAGGDSTTAAPAKETKVLDVCGTISADEVGEILGAAVTSEVGPFDACEYDQDDPRATSAAIDSQLLAELGGGYESFKSGTSGTLTGGETVTVDGVGDDAFITTGSLAGGANTQLQGAVVVGGQLISVNLTQASGIEAPVLVEQAKKLLALAASKA